MAPLLGYAFMHLGTICISGLYLRTALLCRVGAHVLLTGLVLRHSLRGYGTLSGYAFYMHLGTICISGLYLLTPLPLGRGGGATPLFKRDVCSIFPVLGHLWWCNLIAAVLGISSSMQLLWATFAHTLWCNIIALQAGMDIPSSMQLLWAGFSHAL